MSAGIGVFLAPNQTGKNIPRPVIRNLVFLVLVQDSILSVGLGGAWCCTRAEDFLKVSRSTGTPVDQVFGGLPAIKECCRVCIFGILCAAC